MIAGAVVIFLGALLVRLISSMLTDELRAWTPSIVAHLIRSAVLRLREGDRSRFTEEWSSHVSEVPGNLGKLFVAFGFVRASWKMTPDPELDFPFVIVKRAIDLIGSAILLAVLAPLLLVIAAIIKSSSKGPILISESRWGYKNRKIRLFKFRIRRIDNDEYLPLGKFADRANLDVLPQILNVIQGDMSLVGPRPRPLELDDAHPLRCKAKPGITGWAQIQFFMTRDKSIEERIKNENWYAENRSICLDLKILFWTLVGALSGPGPRDHS